MNPRPAGHTTPAVHVVPFGLKDRELTKLVHHTWTCAACRHVERDTDAAVLRAKARDHARRCVVATD